MTTPVNEKFTCSVCNRGLPVSHNGGTGYARNTEGKLLCYNCCAKQDVTSMVDTGLFVGYLVPRASGWYVTNWPATLQFHTTQDPIKSKHNIGRWRYDVWFFGPDGAVWHGVNIGDNMILRCRRLKKQKKVLTPLKEETYLKPYAYAKTT